MATDHRGYELADGYRHIYKLAIVHVTMNSAIRAVRELGLTGAVPVAMGSALAGIGFQRIVVLKCLRDHPPMTQIELERVSEYLSHLRCRLIPNGTFVDISY